MKRRPITLIEVLQPQPFQITPERTRATRTIIQPEIDSFELSETHPPQGKSTRAGRQSSQGAALSRA